jgi:hypothetical protein
MKDATLLYYKRAKEAWVAMCGSTRVELPLAALRKLEGEQLRQFAFAEPRPKPRQNIPVKIEGDAWAVAPA